MMFKGHETANGSDEKKVYFFYFDSILNFDVDFLVSQALQYCCLYVPIVS